MNNQLQIFNNKEFGCIRALNKNGENWFIGKDVTEKLGYSNSSDAIKKHVDKEDKLQIAFCDLQKIGLTEFGTKGIHLINESGLYSLILSSKLPNAKKFKRWVTSEVLPQIRKTGGYIPINQDMDDEEFMARALEVAHRTLKKKDELLKAKTEELEEKNRFLNQISASSNSILVRDVAHLATKQNLKIGEKRLWNKLREWGLIQKNSTKPMQRALEQGLFEKSEFVIQRSNGVETKFTTRVTGKGQVYIIDRLLREVI